MLKKKKTTAKRETILVLCAHNDDQIFGAGGTLARYAKEGKKIRTIIFSFGEASHPHLKREVIIEMRVKESLNADKIIGGSGIAYLGLQEMRFSQEFEKRKIKKKIEWIIKKEKPTKIFTHSINDPHPDHIMVYNLIKGLIDEKKIKCDVYSFDIWNIVNIKNRNVPKLVVDISDTFATKLKAIEAHKSQGMTKTSLLWNVYLKAVVNGWKNNCKYAEVFYKLN